MSKHSKKKPSRKPVQAPARKKVPVGILGLIALAVVAGVVLWLNRSRPEAASPEMPLAETNSPPGAASNGAPAADAGFQKLVGRWQRPDGGYVLALSSVDAGGKIVAGYFNPNSIHVARAEASRDGAALKVFVELRDVNYPGSTYTLTYDPASDQLKGIYFQAALQEQYEIYFERMR
jgi:hypothetical protein